MSTPERGPAGSWQYLALWSNGAMALEATRAALPVSDHDAALIVRDEHGAGWLRRGAVSGTWHVWNGKASVPDTAGWVEKIAADLGTRLRIVIGAARQQVSASVSARLAPDASDALIASERDKAWAGWKKAESYAHGLAKQAGKTALTGYMATHCTVPDDELAEGNPGLLNLDSGTLNLATLALGPHLRSDGLTHVLPIRWDARADCPRFWRLVWRMCGGDAEVAAYVIKCLGYSLLGDNREQKVFFIAGPTGSGKSVMLYVISQVLGTLAHASPPELITVVKGGNRNARTENSIRGARLVSITETSQFMNIDEAQLKRLTGEPVISVNQHYVKTELKTPVTWTIWVATNQMPTLTNYDAAMRRRIIVIPGGPTVPEWETDNRLAEKILSTEKEGIIRALAWGCAEYFRSGLAMPDAVREMTETYAVEQDTVAQFVADTMELGGWSATGGIPQADAWRTYQEWSSGASRLGRNEFMDKMGKHPGVFRNKVSRRFEGVAWNVDWMTRVR